MDAILFWNAVGLEANQVSHSNGKEEQTGPTLSSRALAIMHLAMFDAFVGAEAAGPNVANLTPYLTTPPIAAPAANASIDAAVAADPSVCSLEGLNTRDLAAEHLDGRHIDAVVADVSFISLRLALPPALELAQPGAWGVFLVKPQFEVGRALIAKGGIVRDAAAASRAAESLAAWLEDEHGWSVVGLLPSPISGGDGNREFLLGARRG